MQASLRTEIKNLALDLEVEDTTDNIACPFCGGSVRNPKSFSIKRLATGLVFHCFRGSCGQGGFIPSVSMGSSQYKPAKRQFVPRPFTRALSMLTEKDALFFAKNFELTSQELNINGFRWSSEAERYYLPLLDVRGYSFGGIARKWGAEPKVPKSLTYRTVDLPMLHFPVRQHLTNTVVIVEDIISAIKVARQCSSVALLSCNLNDTQIAILAQLFDHAIIALDPDAIQKAIGLRKKYKLAFRGSLRVAPLSKDPKNLTNEEIKEEIFGAESERPEILSQ